MGRYKNMKKKTLERADHIICISDNTKNDLIQYFNINEKISIRRLQFLKLPKRTLVTIISDNKNYSDYNLF